jgi:hypothetical protein
MLVCLVGQQGMGRSDVMMVNAGKAGLLDRQSFLSGPALGVGALPFAGCVTDGTRETK